MKWFLSLIPFHFLLPWHSIDMYPFRHSMLYVWWVWTSVHMKQNCNKLMDLKWIVLIQIHIYRYIYIYIHIFFFINFSIFFFKWALLQDDFRTCMDSPWSQHFVHIANSSYWIYAEYPVFEWKGTIFHCIVKIRWTVARASAVLELFMPGYPV